MKRMRESERERERERERSCSVFFFVFCFCCCCVPFFFFRCFLASDTRPIFMKGMRVAVLVYLYSILGFCNRGSRSSSCCSCCCIEEVVRVGSCRWSRDGGYLVVVLGVMDGKRGIIKIKAMRKYTCI